MSTPPSWPNGGAGSDYWRYLDRLVAECPLVVDRPRGSPHPRYPDFVYPLDYGYLAGTQTADGAGLDVWVGSLPGRAVTGVIFAVDLDKRDVEPKLLLGCTPEEAEWLCGLHNTSSQAAILRLRD